MRKLILMFWWMDEESSGDEEEFVAPIRGHATISATRGYQTTIAATRSTTATRTAE